MYAVAIPHKDNRGTMNTRMDGHTASVQVDVDRGWVLLRDGVMLPRVFEATIEQVGEPLRATVGVEIDETGGATCRRLTLEPVDGSAVTTSAARNVRVPELLRAAVNAAHHRFVLGLDGSPEPTKMSGADVERFRRDVPDVDRCQGFSSTPMNPVVLERITEIYREALRSGLPPTATVAERQQVARSTAGRWIAAARKAGILGQAIPRKAGEKDEGNR